MGFHMYLVTVWTTDIHMISSTSISTETVVSGDSADYGYQHGPLVKHRPVTPS